MKSLNQVLDALRQFGKGAKDVSSGVAKVTPYIAALTTCTATGGAPLTLAAVVVLAAGAADGIMGIMAVLAEPKKGLKTLPIEERFDLAFHLLCQQAYASAIHKEIAMLDKKLTSAAIDISALKDPGCDDVADARTIWNYDINLDEMRIPLFEACERRIAFLLSATIPQEAEIKAILQQVNITARAFLKLHLSSSEPPYEFVGRYVQLNTLTRIRTASDSMPENIAAAVRDAAQGFLDAPRTAGAKRSWAEYRTHLQEETTKEIFGGDVGIRELYVLPNFTYYRQDMRISRPLDANGDDQLSTRQNLAPFLTHLISNRTSRSNLIFLFGDPGVGKTSFAKMFADALSHHEDFHPVYIPLQYVDPAADLVPEIEKYLQSSPLRAALPELPNCSNVVFILDAFDELAQATRERMGDFFRRLERFASDQLYRNAAVIATGRDTLFSKGDALIPSGTHVITLLPFNRDQIAEWSLKWNKLTSSTFDGTRFWKNDPEKRNDLHDLATQPLLLYLLAKLEQEGKAIDPSHTKTSRSGVYRHLIHWVCERQQEKTPGKSAGSMSSGQMRKLLRLTGFAMMSRGKRAVHLDDLQSLLIESGLTQDLVQDTKNYHAERTFLMFAFSKSGNAAWEFKHKQFGEYLAAEYVAERLDAATQQINDPDEPNEKKWALSADTCAKTWIDLFSRNSLTAEVQTFLEPMLGSWKAFLQAGETATSGRAGELRRLLKRCGQIFSRLVREQDLRVVLDAVNGTGIEPSRALANSLVSVFCVGSASARLLWSLNEKAYFNLEEYAPGGITKAISIIRCYQDIGEAQALRILHGISVESAIGLKLPSTYFPGAFFPFVRISKFAAGTDANKLYSLQINGALLYRADLTGIDLRDAQLMGANLNQADLRKANLQRIYLRGALIRRANLHAANLQHADLGHADLSGANLSDADLRNADLRGAKLFGCNLSRAKLTNAKMDPTPVESPDDLFSNIATDEPEEA